MKGDKDASLTWNGRSGSTASVCAEAVPVPPSPPARLHSQPHRAISKAWSKPYKHTHTHTPRKPGNALMRGHTDDHSPAPRSPDVTKTPCFKRLLLQGRGGRGGGERKKEKKKRKESSGFQQRGGEGFFFSVLQIWFYLAEPWNTFQKLQTYFFGAVFGEDS